MLQLKIISDQQFVYVCVSIAECLSPGAGGQLYVCTGTHIHIHPSVYGIRNGCNVEDTDYIRAQVVKITITHYPELCHIYSRARARVC